MSKRNRSKQKEQSIDVDAQQFNQEVPFTGENLCVDPKCPGNGHKHRHSTADCLKHLFCAQPPLQPIDGTYKDLPEKLPLSLKEWDEWTRKQAYANGKFIGYDHLLSHQNECGYFGYEKDIPDDKKLVVTEEVIDSWLAAHYGLTIEQVPAGKPDGMNKSIHNYLKQTARKTRDLMKDLEKAQKKGNRGASIEDEAPFKKEQRISSVTWQVSPAKFENMYLSKKVEAISYAVKQMKLEDEKNKKSKKRDKNDQQSTEGSPVRSETSLSISARGGFNPNARSLSKGKLPLKVLETEDEHALST